MAAIGATLVTGVLKMALTPQAVLEFESAVMRHAVVGLRAMFLPSRPAGCTYARTSMLSVAGLIVLAGAPGDLSRSS
ncbi:MAG: hypothetical protein ACXWNZ_02675 [Vulcanimicrobiaceae bacterium]